MTLTTPTINGITGGDVGITNASSPYTVPATVKVIRADASAGAITINLPTAVGIAGTEYHIFRTDITASTNIITIDANSTETIDGNLVHYLTAGEWIKIESDGANWISLSRSPVTPKGCFLKGTTASRRYVAGRTGGEATLAASTTSPVANNLQAMPIFVEKTTKFDLISFMVTTLSTAGSARAGIYRDNGNMYPGALIFDTGSIDTSTGSVAVSRDTTITSSLQIFQPGIYWLAWETNSATGQYMCHNTAAPLYGFAGYDNTFTTASVQGYGYAVSHTFGSLPDPYTGGATLSRGSPSPTANMAPVVALRPL